MIKENKQLLLKDLCARIPYGVKVSARYTGTNELYDGIIEGMTYVDLENIEYFVRFTDSRCPYRCGATEVRPYLRPMTSMTEEEKKELKATTCPEGTGYFDDLYLICPMSHFGEYISYDLMSDILNWLNAHHFDYRNLIGKELALRAPEGMYKTE